MFLVNLAEVPRECLLSLVNGAWENNNFLSNILQVKPCPNGVIIVLASFNRALYVLISKKPTILSQVSRALARWDKRAH